MITPPSSEASQERETGEPFTRFFAQVRIERLSRSEEPQKEALRLWTVKEAAFKATSGHTALLKEIKAERESCDGNTTRYGITCIDGSKATCLTTETEGFIASFCTPSCP